MEDIDNREAARECRDQVHEGLAGLIGLDTSDWAPREKLEHLAGLEELVRALQVLGHTLLNQSPTRRARGRRPHREAEEATRAKGRRGRLKLRDAVANTLLITPREATNRIENAKALGIRTVAGEPRAPMLPEAAQAQLQGRVGQSHLRVLLGFDQRLTENVTPEARARANAELADYATKNRPDALRVWANALCWRPNRRRAGPHEIDPPDSPAKQNRRAQRRSLTVSAPDEDGMRRITGSLTPELGELLDALLDQHNRLKDDHDERTFEQRLHDALETILKNAGTGKTRTVVHWGHLPRVQLAKPPAGDYAHTTLEEIAKAGVATTPNGTRIPTRHLTRRASAVIPYLLLFQDKTRRTPLDGGHPPRPSRAVGDYRAKRLATSHIRNTPGVMGRGCSHPRCAVTAQHCAALVRALALPASGPLRSPHIHHIREQRNGGWTNIDNLTLICDHHHHLIDDPPQAGGGPSRLRGSAPSWTVERINGQIHWTAPEGGQPQTNTHHRPQQAA